MEMSQIIKSRRKDLNLTLEEVGSFVGVGKSTVRKWENGDIENMRRDKIAALAEVLQVSINYLMGWDDVPTKSIFDYKNILPMPKMKKVPLLGTIACGVPILAEENIEDYINMAEDVPADYALRCKGDSMINARIFDGDIVFIRQQPDVADGEIAAVLIEDEATLKRVKKYPGKLVLRPENPLYDDIIITGYELESVRIIGRAVAFLSVVR